LAGQQCATVASLAIILFRVLSLFASAALQARIPTKHVPSRAPAARLGIIRRDLACLSALPVRRASTTFIPTTLVSPVALEPTKMRLASHIVRDVRQASTPLELALQMAQIVPVVLKMNIKLQWANQAVAVVNPERILMQAAVHRYHVAFHVRTGIFLVMNLMSSALPVHLNMTLTVFGEHHHGRWVHAHHVNLASTSFSTL
jgi:hypothetical protein